MAQQGENRDRPVLAPTLELPLGAVPRQARSIEKRRHVFEAAMRAYAIHGVARARTEDIIADAGVGWGTFFNYFPRKEDVLLAAAVEMHEQMEADMASVRRLGGTALEVIAAGYRSMATADHPPVLVAAIIREVIATPIRYERLLRRHGFTPLRLTLAELLAAGQEQGVVRPDFDAATLARVMNLALLTTASRVGIAGDVGLPADLDMGALAMDTLRILWGGIGVPSPVAEGKLDWNLD